MGQGEEALRAAGGRGVVGGGFEAGLDGAGDALADLEAAWIQRGQGGEGARLLWDSADAIWRWAGDTATDENHYSKRMILSGVLGPAIALRLSSGRQAANDYIFRRIADVMAFEKWKAGLPKTDIGLQIAGALGRLRYGVKPPPRPSEPPPSV